MLLLLEMWLGWRFWHEKEEGRLQKPLPTPRSASCFSLFSAACPGPEADALLRAAEITCKALLSSFYKNKKINSAYWLQGKAWECELSWVKKNKHKKPTRQS